MAREAARQGIAAEDKDLRNIVDDEHERMACGEPPSKAERDSAQDETEEEDGQSEDLGR